MHRIAYILPAFALLFAGVVHADDDGKERKRAERRLLNIEARVKRMSSPAAEEPAIFLQQETRRLMARCRSFPVSSYESDRMLEALDDLLDALEDLRAATKDKADSNKQDEDRGGSAKRLERAYFRVQQGEYFARLSGDTHAPEYVPVSRQLYQRARAAYDAREYGRANRLASASSELVNVLENLAQAAVRKPEPPVLK